MKNLRKVEKISESYHNAYHETKRHADIMFAYNVYPCTIPQDFSFVPLHWQDSFEIIYVKRGMGRVQVNLDMFQAEAGDIFIVPPGHLHGLRGLEDYRMEYENIIFDMDFLRGAVLDNCSQKYLQPMLEGKLYFPVWIGNSHEMYGILSNYLDAADILMGQRGQGYELGVKIALGSDAGAWHVEHGQGLLDELAMLCRIFSDEEESRLFCRLKAAEERIHERFQVQD